MFVMRNLLLSFGLIFLPLLSVNAQDIITKRSGEEIECKIVSTKGDNVQYVLKFTQSFYTYTIKKSEIQMIQYASGEIVDYNASEGTETYNSKGLQQKQEREPYMSVVPFMNYRQLKYIYDFREYEHSYMDRFSPGWIGFASFMLPGLGEFICDEWGRGLGKLAGAAACAATGAYFTVSSYVDDNWQTDIAFAVIFYAAALGFDIWSIVDAIRIAKVRNMYESDMREKYAFDLNLFPSIDYIPFGNSIQQTAGLTLALRF